MVIKIVPGCVRKLSVGRNQNGHPDLLPLHICGRSWQGCRVGVCTCHRYALWGLKEGKEKGGWGVCDGGGIYGGGGGDKGGGWSRINDEITKIERVEHNTTTIGNNFMNEYGIEDFKVLRC